MLHKDSESDEQVTVITQTMLQGAEALLKISLGKLLPSRAMGLRGCVARLICLLVLALIFRYSAGLVADALLAFDEYRIVVYGLWGLIQRHLGAYSASWYAQIISEQQQQELATCAAAGAELQQTQGQPLLQ
jgi:hypothetical protein